MRTPRVAVAATLMTLTLLSACGGDGDDDSDSSDDTVTATVTESLSETTSAPPTETTSAPTDVTPMDPTDGDITMEQVEAALLTADEIAPGLVLGEWTSESTPPPCDQTATPVDDQVPPSVEAGVLIGTADGGAAMEEEIAIYDTEETAAEAFALGSGGLNCAEATLEDGTVATIGAPIDVTAEVNGASGIGTSTAWEITLDGQNVVLVVTLAGRILVATTFQSAADADTSTLPSPVDVAAAAFAKALAN